MTNISSENFKQYENSRKILEKKRKSKLVKKWKKKNFFLKLQKNIWNLFQPFLVMLDVTFYSIVKLFY